MISGTFSRDMDSFNSDDEIPVKNVPALPRNGILSTTTPEELSSDTAYNSAVPCKRNVQELTKLFSDHESSVRPNVSSSITSVESFPFAESVALKPALLFPRNRRIRENFFVLSNTCDQSREVYVSVTEPFSSAI